MSKVKDEEKEKIIKKESFDNIDKIMNLDYANKFDIEDLLNRRLYLNDEVNEQIFDTIVYHILRYNRLDKGIPVKDRKPIILYINSPGGSVIDGYGVIDSIINSQTPIYTVNQASCFSMGFLIFIAGHKRYAMPHSEFLLHDGSSGFGFESTAKLKDRIEFETVQIENMTKEYIISHSNISEKLYDDRYRNEWYFLPDEGKKLGVVDFIVGKDCTIDDIV